MNEYTDPKTGEKVKKVLVPEFHQKDIEASIQAHQQGLNQFVIYSQQFFDLLDKTLESRRGLNKTDALIKEKMQFACKKIGLSSTDPWNYNLVEKLFEMREPPDIMPFSAGNLLQGYHVTDKLPEPTPQELKGEQ